LGNGVFGGEQSAEIAQIEEAAGSFWVGVGKAAATGRWGAGAGAGGLGGGAVSAVRLLSLAASAAGESAGVSGFCWRQCGGVTDFCRPAAEGCHSITPAGPRICHRQKTPSSCEPFHSAITLVPAWLPPKQQEVPMRIYIEVVLTIIGLLGAYMVLLPLIT
jgi:hypothetical protein